MNKQKYFIRRNLDMYSELEFSKELVKKGFVAYYPFKDVGIDIIAIKNNKVYNYQLKARSLNRFGNYSFMVHKRKLDKYVSKKNMYYVLCALLPNNRFDFFIIPIKIVNKWFKEYRKKIKKKESHFLVLKPDHNKNYTIVPDWLKNKIRVGLNKYKLI